MNEWLIEWQLEFNNISLLDIASILFVNRYWKTFLGVFIKAYLFIIYLLLITQQRKLKICK